MLLDRIDIDTHGPLRSVELGPFSEHLNVVSAPSGSGKTALVRFIRDSLVQRDYPLGMLSSSAGRVVWADRNGLVHCRRETDGTATGRRTVEFERRGSIYPDARTAPLGYETAAHQATPWLGGHQALSDHDVALQTIELPAAIIDGIVTDTAVTDIGRVVASAIAAGLDDPTMHRDLPLHHDSLTSAYRDNDASSYDAQAAGVRAELADIDAELAALPTRTSPSVASRISLQRRRRALLDAIDRINLRRVDNAGVDTASVEQLHRLHDRAYDLRVRRDAIARWLHHLDARETEYRRNDWTEGYRYRTDLSSGKWGNQDLLSRVDAIDCQIASLGRVTESLQLLAATIRTAAQMSVPPWRSPWDAEAIAADRYRSFLGAIDRHDSHRWDAPAIDRHWDRREFYSTTHRPARYTGVGPMAADASFVDAGVIDARIGQTIRQIDDAGRLAIDDVSETLSSIRHDVANIRWNQAIGSPQGNGAQASADARIIAQLADDERLVTTLTNRLRQDRRDALARQHSAGGNIESWTHGLDWYALQHDRDHSRQQLAAIERELVATLNHAASLRRSFRQLPLADGLSTELYSSTHINVDRGGNLDAMRSELAHVEAMLSDDFVINHPIDGGREAHLRARRDELLRQIPMTRPVTPNRHPLAEIASRWLVRLSGGTLRHVDWSDSDIAAATRRPVAVRVDNRNENEMSAADRAITVIAVRMAAAGVMADLGRPTPLVIEIHAATLAVDSRHSAYADRGRIGRVNHPIAAALRDYAGGGHNGTARQIIVLTEDATLAGQLGRVGARSYQIEVRTSQAQHRPLWRPHYQDQPYHGVHRPTEARSIDYYPTATRYDDNAVSSSPVTPPSSSWRDEIRTHDDINRVLDSASMYSDAMVEMAQHPGNANIRADGTRTDWAMPMADDRNGVYYANQSTTDRRHDRDGYRNANGGSVSSAMNNGHQDLAVGESFATSDSKSGQTVRAEIDVRPVSPYFLSVDSPIDQAPSIDAVAASRLRACKVTHVTHLMSRDSNRLADALGLTHVDASTIRYWQSECRLVTQVPQLRGFDARVLVGCGITTPSQLAAIHPTDLLRDVEAFLATHRGQQILLSGSSHELSRLTSWIAAANAGAVVDHEFDHDRYEVSDRGDRSPRTRVRRRRYRVDADGTRHEIENIVSDIEPVRAFERDRADDREIRAASSRGFGVGRGSSRNGHSEDGSSRRSGGERSNIANSRRSSPSRSSSNQTSSNRSSGGTSSSRSFGGTPTQERSRGEQSPIRQRTARDEKVERPTSTRQESYHSSYSENGEWRFYLNRQDAVVDAPSIGPRMAARLEQIGIQTVDDLLTTDAETIADGLDHRRIDAEIVLQWQQQATLVCRVPMLRGHDAQLLVAADVTTPEQLAMQNAAVLFPEIDAIVRSAEGKRIVRGGKLPDLEEVTEWIQYAGHHRQLQAA